VRRYLAGQISLIEFSARLVTDPIDRSLGGLLRNLSINLRQLAECTILAGARSILLTGLRGPLIRLSQLIRTLALLQRRLALLTAHLRPGNLLQLLRKLLMLLDHLLGKLFDLAILRLFLGDLADLNLRLVFC
jgi:hypothetical protein